MTRFKRKIPLLIVLVAIPAAFAMIMRAAEITTEVAPGWRLVSLPYQQETAVSLPCNVRTTPSFGISGDIYLCDAFSRWPAGNGFWAYFDRAIKITVSGAPVSIAAPFTVTLQPGWNIIGTPFLFPVDVAKGITVDGVALNLSDAVVPEIYEYDPGDNGYKIADTLKPWLGYMIFAKQSAELRMIAETEGEKPGAPASIEIVDSNGGPIVALDLDPGTEVTLKAAGYDAEGRFTGYVAAQWSSTGGVSSLPAEPADTATFTAGAPGARGTITAAADTLADHAVVVVIGTGDLFEYPFTETTAAVEDTGTGLPAVAGQAIVAFKPGTPLDRAREVIEGVNGKLVGYNAAAGLCQVKMPAGAQFEAYRAGLLAVSDVVEAAPNYVFETGGLPNDPIFGPGAPAEQRWGYEKIRMHEVWDAIYPVGSPTIAVVDTGLDTTHPDIAGGTVPGRNFIDPSAPDDVTDQSGHGTAVAGVIAARPNNGIGIAGVCENCKIMPLKACNGGGACPLFDVANAITYAADQGADVINLSLGAHLDPNSPAVGLLEQIINYAASKGSILVGAAGNENKDAGDYYPAAFSSVISVAATDDQDARASFSNYGASVKLAAPGVGIYTTVPGSYDYADGTSIAAGYVSGLAGLILSIKDGLPQQTIEIMLESTAQPVQSDQPISGRVDASLLLSYFGGYNSAPVITGIEQDARAVTLGAAVKLRAQAVDPDGDTISYEWTTAAGTISDAVGQETTWTLPSQEGDYKITITVSDAYGKSSSADAYVLVMDGRLEFVKVTPENKTVNAGEIVQYSAFCLDHDAYYSGAPPIECHADWIVTGNVGSIDAGGKFAALTPGAGYIVAEVGGIAGSTPVAVNGGSGGTLYTAAVNDTPCDTVWPMPRCNTGGTNEAVQSLYPKLTWRWMRSFGSGIVGQAVASGGKIYFTDQGCNLHCVNQSDGSDCWVPASLNLGAGQIWSAAAFSTDMNSLFVTTTNGDVYKVNISGAAAVVTWSWRPGAGVYAFFSSPAVVSNPPANDIVLVTSDVENGMNASGRIYALRDDGAFATLLWKYPAGALTVGGFHFAAPSFATDVNGTGTDMVFAGDSWGWLYAVNMSNGTMVWPANTFTCGLSCQNTATVSEYGGKTYVYTTSQSGSGYLRKHDPDPVTGGSTVWSSADIGETRAPPAHRGDIFYILTMTSPSKIYAIQDNGNGPADYQILWTTTPTTSGGSSQAPTLYDPTLYGGGLIFTYGSNGAVGTVDTSNGNLLWQIPQGNIGAQPIVMDYSGSAEAYFGTSNGYFIAWERNWPPYVVSSLIDPATVDIGAAQGASATIFCTDQNGLLDLDHAYVDLTPIGGPSQVDFYHKVSPFIDQFATTTVGSKIIPAKGTKSGLTPLTATVFDIGGLSGTGSINLIVGNSAPSIISSALSPKFSPDYIYPDGADSTTLTVIVEDWNGEILNGVEVDLTLIGGLNPTTLTCGTYDPVTWRTTCTTVTTAAPGTLTGWKTLPVQVRDGAFTITPVVQPTLEIVGVDHYELTADTPHTAGSASTVQLKAYSSHGFISTYNNTAAITLETLNESGVISFTGGPELQDLGGGNATLDAGAFTNGVATFYITDQTVESGITVLVTDTDLKNGTSNPIEWIPGAPAHFHVSWENGPFLSVGSDADMKIVVHDIYHNICTNFTNPNGLTISYNLPSSPPPANPATLSYSDTLGAVTDLPPTGTANFAAGAAYFSAGVGTFNITDTFPDTNVLFRVTEKVTGVAGVSDPVTWNAGSLDYFTFVVTNPPFGNPKVGDTVTLEITAYDLWDNKLDTYNNFGDIELTVTSGTAATTTWGGAGVTDNPPTGNATLAGGNFINGVATVTLINTSVETQTVKATEYDAPPPNVNASANITWDVGTLDHFHVDPSTTSTVAGQSVTITVTAKDLYDHTITDYSNPNGIILSQTGGTPGGFSWNGIPGPTMSLNGDIFVNGVYNSINVTDSLVDSGVRIVATENAPGSAIGQSVPIDWTDGTLTSFTFVVTNPPAGNPKVGDTATLQITAYNQYGIVMPTYNNTANITLSVVSGTAATTTWGGAGVTPTTPGNAELAGGNFTGGIATVTLINTSVETQTVRATEHDAPAPDKWANATLTWDVGPFNHFHVDPSTTSTVAGQSVTITVTAKDLYDHTITDYSTPGGIILSQTGGTPSGFSWTGADVIDNGAPTYTASLDGTAFVSGVYNDIHVTDSLVNSGVRIVATETSSGISDQSVPIDWTGGTFTSFTFDVVNPPSGHQTVGGTVTLEITALNEYGVPMTTYNNTANIILRLTSGTAATTTWGGAGVTPTTPGNATLAGGNFIGGVATVTLTNTTAESQTVSATEYDAPLPNISASTNITWDAGPLNNFIVQESASSAVVGTAVDITVTAKDLNGNTITDFSNPNGIVMSQTGGTPGGFSWNGTPGPTMSLNGDIFENGVYSDIHVTDNIMDSGVRIVATENLPGSSTGQSGPIAWTPGALGSFHIAASPTSRIVGQSTRATVTAYDTLGNVKINWNSNVNLQCMNGTLAKLIWSGPGVSGTGPGKATLNGAQFAGGIAFASLTHTLPEGPITIKVDNFGAIASQTAVIDSPTWTVGPLASIIIRDASNGGGAAIGNRTMAAGETLNVWAAGYDAYNNYRQDESATWSTTLPDPIGDAGPAVSSFFTPVTENTSGTIHADAGGGITDDTGTISVLTAEPKAPVITAQGQVEQILVSWPPVTEYINGAALDPNLLKYEVWRTDTPGVWDVNPYYTTATATTTFTDTAVTVWVTYYYKVKAWNTPMDRRSVFSNIASAASIREPFIGGRVCEVINLIEFFPPSTPGYLNRPSDLALGGSVPATGKNYVYIADTDNHRISVFDEDCNYITIWGSFGLTLGKYKKPTGILYQGGLVYVADGGDRIQVVDAGTGTALKSYPVSQPWKIEWGPGGNILIASSNNRVYLMNPTSGVIASSFNASSPRGVVYNPTNGLIYASDATNGYIRAYDAGGTEQTANRLGFGNGSAYGQLNLPMDLAVDSAGNIYVADRMNNRVQVFATNGSLLNVIGSSGIGSNNIRQPAGIGFSPRTGNLWVADYLNQRFVEFQAP